MTGQSHTDTAHDAAGAAWIDRAEALADWLDAVPASAVLALDTEFMRRNTFFPQLALVQLGHRGRQALVDPLAFDAAPALERLQHHGVVVMHSAGEDLEALAPLLPEGPQVLFDTQIAAAFVGLGLGLSYGALVSALLGVQLDKSEARSDWLQRPLSAAQQSYAALDVRYLEPLHEALRERLQASEREAWHAEDCERLKARASQRAADLQPQRALRAAAGWNPERQALLRRLLNWREQRARSLNRPRPWLLEDTLALDLVQSPPRSPGELETRSRAQRALRAGERAELFALLAKPVSPEEVAATAPIPGYPQGPLKQALAAMKDYVDELAAELDIPPGLLCPRKALEEYVVTTRWPEQLTGWRQGQLERGLSSLLP
jgi:ribonuclease D